MYQIPIKKLLLFKKCGASLHFSSSFWSGRSARGEQHYSMLSSKSFSMAPSSSQNARKCSTA